MAISKRVYIYNGGKLIQCEWLCKDSFFTNKKMFIWQLFVFWVILLVFFGVNVR